MFFKYLIWFRSNAYTIGGLSNLPIFDQRGEIFRESFESKLEIMRGKHSEQYPTVSLYNLDKDPTESNNLASVHPGDIYSVIYH